MASSNPTIKDSSVQVGNMPKEPARKVAKEPAKSAAPKAPKDNIASKATSANSRPSSVAPKTKESQIISYKCPSCGAVVKWDAKSRQAKCEACGNTYSIQDLKDQSAGAGDEGFVWEDYFEELTPDEIAGTKSYICQSCGAEIVTDAITAATKCPYCDNTVVLKQNLEKQLKPNSVIPFTIDKKQLKLIRDEYTRNRPLLPKNFITDSKIDETVGMYVPFWLYDCRDSGEATFEGTRTRQWEDRDYYYKETSFYDIDVRGKADFEQIPADASDKMDDALMDSIEPFHFSDLREFDSAYFSGFVADRFDVTADQALHRAHKRADSTTLSLFRSEIYGFETVSYRYDSLRLSDVDVKYAMLPVYLINSTFKGEKYTFAVNGQTGKMTGRLPISWGRFWAWFFGVLVAGTAVSWPLCYFFYTLFSKVKHSTAGLPSSVAVWITVVAAIMGLIAALITTLTMKGKMNPVHEATSAASAYVPGSLDIDYVHDRFTHKIVDRTPKPKDNNNNRGNGGIRF